MGTGAHTSKPRLHTTASEDRADGRVATDPQTALERSDQEGRLAGSGVRSKDPEGEKEFHQYEQFLNSAYLNLAAGEIHDYFNREGLTVTNEAGQQFIVGGDGHMLSIQSEAATLVAIQANTLADQAISEILATGTSSVSVEDIFKLFPSKVVIEGADHRAGAVERQPCSRLLLRAHLPGHAGEHEVHGRPRGRQQAPRRRKGAHAEGLVS